MPREGEGGGRRTAGALIKEPQLNTAASRDTANAFAFICDDHRPPLQQKMIVRARVVVTMDGPPIENGAVRVRGERIIEVGKFSDLADTDEIADLGDHILLPGLINAHCHLDYTCLRGKIAPPQSFTDWIRAINAEKEKLSAGDYVASINQGFAKAKQFGTTFVPCR